MTKKCILFQPAGLGDVLFIQKIAHHLVDEGYQVYYPLLSGLMYIADYLETDGITFVAEEAIPTSGIDSFYHVRDADTPQGRDFFGFNSNVSRAACKYIPFNIDYLDWQKYITLKRNYEKEESLKNKLNLPSEYCLVNRNFGTPPGNVVLDFDVDTDLPVINMGLMEGYTLFDWCGVIEEATEIYSVETAINYLIDILPIKAKKLEGFSRYDPPTYKPIEGIFKAPWNWNL